MNTKSNQILQQIESNFPLKIQSSRLPPPFGNGFSRRADHSGRSGWQQSRALLVGNALCRRRLEVAPTQVILVREKRRGAGVSYKGQVVKFKVKLTNITLLDPLNLLPQFLFNYLCHMLPRSWRNYPLDSRLVLAAYVACNGCCSKEGKRSNKEPRFLPCSSFKTNFWRVALKCKVEDRAICNRSGE